ncbi:Kinesin light chain [Chlorella vulgaris]
MLQRREKLRCLSVLLCCRIFRSTALVVLPCCTCFTGQLTDFAHNLRSPHTTNATQQRSGPKRAGQSLPVVRVCCRLNASTNRLCRIGNWLRCAHLPGENLALVTDQPAPRSPLSSAAMPSTTREQLYPPLIKGSVYPLYLPEDDANKPDNCWPTTLLAKDFPHARILSVSYDSSARAKVDQGKADLGDIRKQLVEALVNDRVKIGDRPLFMVGHSLGGIVIADVCNELFDKASRGNERHQKALNSVAGFVFYATPWAGAPLADKALRFFAGGEVMTYLTVLSKKAALIRIDFVELCTRLNWTTKGFYEKDKTSLGGSVVGKVFNAEVVGFASATLVGSNPVMLDADHITVCKFTKDNELGYAGMKDYLVDALEKLKVVTSYVKTVHGNMLVGRDIEQQELKEAMRKDKLAVVVGGPGEGKSALAYELAVALESAEHLIGIKDFHLGAYTWPKDKAKALHMLAGEGWGAETNWSPDLCKQPRTVMVYHDTEAIISAGFGAAAAFYELVRQMHEGEAYQIVTSRFNLAPHELPKPAPKQLKLNSLSKEAARTLLMRKCDTLTKQQADQIADMCACNALLITLLGGGLAAGDITPQACIQSGIRVNQNDASVHNKVEAVRDSVKFLFKAYPDQLEWIAEMSQWASFTAEQASSTTQMEKPKLLEKMVRLSVLHRVDERYGMHVLVREAAGDIWNERPQLHLDANARFVHAMADVGDRVSSRTDYRSIATTLSPDLGNCRRFCPIPDDVWHDIPVRRGVSGLADKLRMCGLYTEAEAVTRQVCAACHRVFGEDHLDTLMSMNNLANVLNDRGKRDHPDTLRSMINLANVLKAQGKHVEAEELYRGALAGRRRVLGEDHPDTLMSMNNLANVLKAQGKHFEAEELYRGALTGRRRVLGEDHPDTLMSMNNLAVELIDQGKHIEAEELLRGALAGMRRVLGEDHSDTLRSMINLANVLNAQGKHVEAEELYLGALAGRRLVLGEDHPNTQQFMLHCIACTPP